MPLTGLKVLDLTRVVSGPFCTMMLADLGADVIKIEAPDGDPSRVTGIMGKGENPYFVNLNRNKRTITVDMKQEEGKEIIRRLAKRSDVLVENFRPGVMDRLGLGYNQLSILNPALIYAAISTGALLFGRVMTMLEIPQKLTELIIEWETDAFHVRRIDEHSDAAPGMHSGDGFDHHAHHAAGCADHGRAFDRPHLVCHRADG